MNGIESYLEERGITADQMEAARRYTQGYVNGSNLEEAIDSVERLRRFEGLLADWVAERESVEATLAELRAQGKVRTATYQQLTARKLALQSILGQCEERGLL